LDPFWRPYAERNQLFANDGGGRFRDISPQNAPFCGTAWVARGLACGDVDGDGALDLLVTTVAGPARLYRNVPPKRGHWLMVRAIDPALKRDAYGAEITVYAGERRWQSWINPGYSYACSNDARAHFGLGQAGRVDRIQVIWPDGAQEHFPGCAVDQQVVLRKGQGSSPRSGQARENGLSLTVNVENKSYWPSDVINLSFKLSNETDRDMFISDGFMAPEYHEAGPGRHFEVHVTADDKHPLSFWSDRLTE